MTTSPFGSVTDNRIVDETALENNDPVFTQEELDRMSNTMLRRLAANAETNEINGKSLRLEIVSYFRCQRSLGDY